MSEHTQFFTCLNKDRSALNIPGSLINILDACLVNGFNINNVTSLVVTNNVATVQCSNHGYEIGQLILIYDANETQLNGEFRIKTKSTNSFTYVPDTQNVTGTGSIKVKLAPLGWTKEFSGTNIGVYKQGGLESSGYYLMVSDTGIYRAKVELFYNMTALGVGDKVMQYYYNVSNQYNFNIFRRIANNANNRPWVIIGNKNCFYLFIISQQSITETDWYTYPNNGGFMNDYFFGRIVSNYEVGNFAIIGPITETSLDSSSYSNNSLIGTLVNERNSPGTISTPKTLIANDLFNRSMGVQFCLNSGFARLCSHISVINNPNFELHLSDIHVIEENMMLEYNSGASYCYRGKLPGIDLILESKDIFKYFPMNSVYKNDKFIVHNTGYYDTFGYYPCALMFTLNDWF
jgi:hypothetical protein